MSDILNKTIVLVLNRNWQPINIRTPADVFCQMATNVATALEIELGHDARAEALRPVSWDEWITLPVRNGDHAVRTVHGAIRVPTVIVETVPQGGPMTRLGGRASKFALPEPNDYHADI